MTLEKPAGPGTTPAIRLLGARRLKRVESAIRPPGEGEVIVQVRAVGLCGSDAHWYNEGGIGESGPGNGLVLGHEIAGEIASGPRLGERVVVDPAIPCRRCELCRAGRENLCPRVRFAGHGDTDGGLTSFLVWPERSLTPLPENLTFQQGTLLEPLGVALHAVDLVGGVTGAKVAVVGLGPIGLLLVAAIAGDAARVVATDLLAHRVEAAQRLGATEGMVVESDAWTDEGAFDVVFETAGSDDSANAAILAAAPGGRVALVGIPDQDRISYVASIARRKELTLVNCRRMLANDLVRAARLAEAGEADLNDLVTHRFPLAQAEEAFETLITRIGIKVVVEP